MLINKKKKNEKSPIKSSMKVWQRMA